MSEVFTDKEKAIMRYVEIVATDVDSFGDAEWEDLRAHLSEDEIAELGLFLVGNLGFHTFFGSLKFYPMFSPNGELVTQEESAAIYGATPGSLQSEAAE